MNSTQRAEWQRIRAEERAALLDRRAAHAAKLDPSWIAGARVIYDALTEKHFKARIGFGPKQHCVSVSSVTADEKTTVEGMANSALKKSDAKTTLFVEAVHFQSFILLEVKEGREVFEFERWRQRHGEDGMVLCFDAQGFPVDVGEMNHTKPLANTGLGDDVYGLNERKAS